MEVDLSRGNAELLARQIEGFLKFREITLGQLTNESAGFPIIFSQNLQLNKENCLFDIFSRVTEAWAHVYERVDAFDRWEKATFQSLNMVNSIKRWDRCQDLRLLAEPSGLPPARVIDRIAA